MKKLIFLLLAAGMILETIPPTLGQTAPAHGESNQNCFPPFVVTQVIGQIAAGTIQFCADAPAMTATTTSTFQVAASLTTPQILGAVGTNTITLGASANGCTLGTQTTRQTGLAAAFGSQTSTTAFVTMTSDACTILWEGKVTVATTVIVYDAFEATNIYANPLSKVDNQNRLCAASAFGSSCQPDRDRAQATVSGPGYIQACSQPFNVVAGSVFNSAGYIQSCVGYPPVVNSGLAVRVSTTIYSPDLAAGVGDTSTMLFSSLVGCTASNGLSQNFILDSNELVTQEAVLTMTGESCTGYMNIIKQTSPGGVSLKATIPIHIKTTLDSVTNSGTQHLIIDSWPSLTAAVTNSGTVNIVNSGGQTMTLSGTVGVTGSLTVTNAGGQNIAVTSWPQLNAVLSGGVNTTASLVNIGNSTINFPSTLHLCGGVLTNGTCAPVSTSSTVTTPGLTGDLLKTIMAFWPILTFLASFLLPTKGKFAGTAIRVVSLLAMSLLPNMPGDGRAAFAILAVILLLYEVFADEKGQKTEYSLPY